MADQNECTKPKCDKLGQMKITVVGDACVGKTCVLITYKQKIFPEFYVPTVFENYPDQIEVDGETFDVCLWDTAGNEDYSRLRPLTYTGTHCFLLCFAVDDPKSFENVLSKWYPELQQDNKTIPVILVGTKSDLRKSRTTLISQKEALKMKKRIKAASYIECSALENQNVDKMFQDAVRVIIRKSKPRNCLVFGCLKTCLF